MSEKVIDMEDRILPVKLTDNETGNVYELDFCRESVRFAEARKFEVEDVGRFPNTGIPELFYLAFRKNHKNVARSKTDAILDKMGGLSKAFLERLITLYQQAEFAHVIVTDEEAEKNSAVTVEL